jgi:ribokinase
MCRRERGRARRRRGGRRAGSATTRLLQLEVPAPKVIALAARAHDRGSRVILNLAPPAPVPDALLDAVDVLVANEHEAEFVAREYGLPSDPADFCAGAADRWRLAAIVTLGADGLVAADAGHRYRLPAATVDGVRDTTAAGDAFAGALAAPSTAALRCATRSRRASPRVRTRALATARSRRSGGASNGRRARGIAAASTAEPREPPR